MSSKPRRVGRAEKGIVSWVCWTLNKDYELEDALELIRRADRGMLWLHVSWDVAHFYIGEIPIGAIHVRGVLAAGEWGERGPSEGFVAFQDYWGEFGEYVEEQQAELAREIERTKLWPDVEEDCPV